MVDEHDDPAEPVEFVEPGMVERDPDSTDEFAADAPAGRRIGDSVALQFVASLIVPGVAAVRRAPLIAIALFVAGVVLPIGLMVRAAANRDDLIGFALDERLLTWVTIIGILAVAARVAAVAEVAVRHRASPHIVTKTAVATVALVAIAVPSALVLSQVNHTRGVVGDVFSSSDDDTPLFASASDDVSDGPTDGDGDGSTGTSDQASGTADQGADPTVPPFDGDGDGDGDGDDGGDEEPGDAGDDDQIDPNAIRTTLLLGGDDGPNRWGVRTDTMILFMVHEATGRTAVISIPRNLMRLQFPPESPLGEKFPNGFDDLANAVFTHVRTRPELVEAYASSEPSEVIALTQGIGYSLDVTIHDYVLINMQAFLDVVDAVGGVTVNVPKRVELQDHNPIREYDVPDTLGPGRVDLDGTLALAYVRARQGDSDYFRMGRQRDVLAALGSQVSTRDAINAFPKVADALEGSMKTSLSSSEFSELLDRLGDSVDVGETVGLAPPLITPSRPDFDEIKSIIAAVRNYVRTGDASGYDS